MCFSPSVLPPPPGVSVVCYFGVYFFSGWRSGSLVFVALFQSSFFVKGQRGKFSVLRPLVWLAQSSPFLLFFFLPDLQTPVGLVNL